MRYGALCCSFVIVSQSVGVVTAVIVIICRFVVFPKKLIYRDRLEHAHSRFEHSKEPWRVREIPELTVMKKSSKQLNRVVGYCILVIDLIFPFLFIYFHQDKQTDVRIAALKCVTSVTRISNNVDVAVCFIIVFIIFIHFLTGFQERALLYASKEIEDDAAVEAANCLGIK